MGGCGDLERTDFEQFLLWDSVVVLKELILNSVLLWKGMKVDVVVLKELILNSFYLGEGGVVILKELILNSFYCGRVW